MNNKLLVTILTIVLVSFCDSVTVVAAEKPRVEKPEDVVARLYRDFRSDHFDNDLLMDLPMKILKNYFTSRLAALIIKDRKYEIRTKELGHIDFDLIFGSQDPDGISNIRINKKPGTNIISVLYDQNGEKDVMRLDFITEQTGSEWRISDIHYKSRKSQAFPYPGSNFSLVELLSRKY